MAASRARAGTGVGTCGSTSVDRRGDRRARARHRTAVAGAGRSRGDRRLADRPQLRRIESRVIDEQVCAAGLHAFERLQTTIELLGECSLRAEVANRFHPMFVEIDVDVELLAHASCHRGNFG